MAKQTNKNGLDALLSDPVGDTSVLTSVMIPVKLKKKMALYCAQHDIKMKDLILRGIKREMNIEVDD
ncbi:MAG: hypothetical protein LBV47_08310 [Bacteroidales bacterium]|jgi:hypothetical protein|nr:hypothetical protein [Bacteroidales bacterium]